MVFCSNASEASNDEGTSRCIHKVKTSLGRGAVSANGARQRFQGTVSGFSGQGIVGLPLFHGVDRTAAQCFCQVPGEALRMSAASFQDEVRRNGVLAMTLGRYTQALFTQVAQSSACNRVHTMRARCARWLLQTHDRVTSDTFCLTQRFLTQMLGVRRATVTEAAGSLQSAGLIEYKMGTIRVLDRQGLESAACECYLIISRELERLLDGRESPNPFQRVHTSSHGQSELTEPTPRSEQLENENH